jgi:hypothetical protein
MDPTAWGAHGGILQGGADLAGAFLNYPLQLAAARERAAAIKRQEERDRLADAFRARDDRRADMEFERRTVLDAEEREARRMKRIYEGLENPTGPAGDALNPSTSPEYLVQARGIGDRDRVQHERDADTRERQTKQERDELESQEAWRGSELDRMTAAEKEAARRAEHAAELSLERDKLKAREASPGGVGGGQGGTSALLEAAVRAAEAEANAGGYGTGAGKTFVLAKQPDAAVRFNATLRRHYEAAGARLPKGTQPNFSYTPGKVLSPQDMSATFDPPADAPYRASVLEQQNRITVDQARAFAEENGLDPDTAIRVLEQRGLQVED